MAKELPYFKFYVSEWNDGDITLETLETQGFFINLCSYYWSNGCELSLKKARKKFITQIDLGFKILIEEKIISIKKDCVKISFLDEQWKDRGVKTLTNRQNGAKGGRPKKNPMGLISETQTESEGEPKQKALREEEIRRDKTVAKYESELYQFTEKFYSKLKKSGISMTHPKNPKSDTNVKNIHLLLKDDEERTLENIKVVANYYFDNINEEFMPDIQSTKSFRDKYHKIINHCERAERNSKSN